MENDEILRPLRLTAQLLELHDENPFKIRSYQNAVIALERVNDNLADLPPAQLAAIQGVGKSIAANVATIREGGSFPELENLVAKTPEGVLDMLRIKGIGPKKVRTLWRELGVETTDTLLQACEENRVAQLKGFGEKTQENIKQALLFTRQAAGKLHYAEAEAVAGGLLQRLRDAGIQAGPAGQLARKNDIVDTLQLLTAAPNPAAVHGLLDGLPGLRRDDRTTAPFSWRGTLEGSEMPLEVLIARPEKFVNQSFICSAAPDHLRYRDEKGHTLLQIALHGKFEAEEAIYAQAGLPYIIPELREGLFEFDLVKAGKLGNLIRSEDLKGILHNHSTYSDGRHTLAEMANYCKELGYQYLGISDHSKSAYYAGGLTEEFVAKQHREIDELNKQLAPFRIFKGIESDILNDGSLDYDNDVLASFDFIVASVHSNLKMDEAKATARLIRAVENPYTTILGHPTGRLLLRREGYPIDHQKVIDACAANEVIIEINANPWRLDIDWHWLPYALNKGVLISINPDAHEKAGYHDMQYGVHVARKGGLPVDMTFNAWPLDRVEAYLKAKKG